MASVQGPAPRYDGLADWYDDLTAAWADGNGVHLLDLLGPGTGLCLDLGCGTGQNLGTLRATGRTVVGLDYSADQLRLAERRRAPGEPLIRGDAAALPFADATFPTVVTVWLSTDVDDFTSVVREAARVLRPGGTLVCYGAHPCFTGPHTEDLPDGGRVVHPTYRTPGWHSSAPWWREDGVRRRLGMRHTPLAELLNAFVSAGLVISRFLEPPGGPVPRVLALRAEKPAA
ncbi:methyltransferase domain-containing protein [Nonomuraea phyllanthi]|uniref:Methyltransferase domain-containing protein n=1 Tax=Nonomuraea phyllanthi TaxID=2219224 RepID=A0A5C4WC49_9ACTN|nr:methyltransferase domain-containing protein [Nonomuraea phyllanthi]QFY11086.1 methyltransferase domain-containing protein [Nonomuraea phyllanthi]